jgi:hypothetical protein
MFSQTKKSENTLETFCWKTSNYQCGPASAFRL